MRVRFRFKSILLAILAVLLITPTAFAALSAAGPPDPATHFPQYYMDANGVTAWLPSPPLGPFGTPTTQLAGPTTTSMIFDPIDPLAPFSATVGFGTEAFYYNTTAVALPPVGSTATWKLVYVAGLEATFANVPPSAVNGQQTVFSRIRVVFKKPTVAGVYTFRHPYGTEAITVTAADITNKRDLKLTRDIPAGVPLDFTTALSGDVGPFLKQAVPPPVISPGTPPPFDTATWLGDGFTPATVTGSPTGFNSVRLTAPAGVNLDGAGNNFIETSTFVTSGVSFPAPGVPGGPPPGTVITTPLTVDSATFSRTRASMTFNVFATAPAGSTVTVDIFGVPYALTGDVNGKFFLSKTLFRPLPAIRPATLTVTATGPVALGMTPTSVSANLTDQVIITQAVYNTRTKRLTVTAASSDATVQTILTLASPALGVMGRGGTVTRTFNVATPPANVIVSSSLGGTGTAPVSVVTR